MTDPVLPKVAHPPLSLLVKLGSIARHAQELDGPDGQNADLVALRVLLNDDEVVEWMALASSLSLLPVLR